MPEQTRLPKLTWPILLMAYYYLYHYYHYFHILFNQLSVLDLLPALRVPKKGTLDIIGAGFSIEQVPFLHPTVLKHWSERTKAIMSTMEK